MKSLSTLLPENSFTYEDYIRELEAMVKNKSTSGENQSENLVKYTYLNYKRMKRLNKTVEVRQQIIEAIEQWDKKVSWIVITEAWCGDAAQNIPLIAKIASLTSKVDLRLVYRDENPSFMENYLTNGAKSIPKLIGFDALTGDELFVWGPRPAPVQKMVLDNKALPETERLSYDKFSEGVHRWYAKDKNATLQNELLHIFRAI